MRAQTRIRNVLCLPLMLTAACSARTDAAASRSQPCIDEGGPVPLEAVVRDVGETASLFDTMLRLQQAPDTLAVMIHRTQPTLDFTVVDSAAMTPPIRFALRRSMERTLLTGPGSRGRVWFGAYLDGDSVRMAAERTAFCRPEILNLPELRHALEEAQSRLMREGSTMLVILVDESGTPADIFVGESSGDPALDAVAVSVGFVARFRPATVRNQPMPVYVGLPITFVR